MPALLLCEADREGARAGDPGSGGKARAPLPARVGVSVAVQVQGLLGLREGGAGAGAGAGDSVGRKLVGPRMLSRGRETQQITYIH